MASPRMNKDGTTSYPILAPGTMKPLGYTGDPNEKELLKEARRLQRQQRKRANQLARQQRKKARADRINARRAAKGKPMRTKFPGLKNYSTPDIRQPGQALTMYSEGGTVTRPRTGHTDHRKNGMFK